MKLRNKKTGEIVTLKDEGDLALLKLLNNSLPNGLRLWEEVKEPLIKDEKIRKAVRAWAEANDYGNDEVYEFEDFWTSWRSWSLEHRGDDNEIHFNGGIDFDKMNHRGTYTITELCGEEDEKCGN